MTALSLQSSANYLLSQQVIAHIYAGFPGNSNYFVGYISTLGNASRVHVRPRALVEVDVPVRVNPIIRQWLKPL